MTLTPTNPPYRYIHEHCMINTYTIDQYHNIKSLLHPLFPHHHSSTPYFCTVTPHTLFLQHHSSVPCLYTVTPPPFDSAPSLLRHLLPHHNSSTHLFLHHHSSITCFRTITPPPLASTPSLLHPLLPHHHSSAPDSYGINHKLGDMLT